MLSARWHLKLQTHHPICCHCNANCGFVKLIVIIEVRFRFCIEILIVVAHGGGGRRFLGFDILPLQLSWNHCVYVYGLCNQTSSCDIVGQPVFNFLKNLFGVFLMEAKSILSRSSTLLLTRFLRGLPFGVKIG